MGVLLLLLIISPRESVPKVPTDGIRISEVMADNVSAYPDEMGRYGDWIELENASNVPVNLKGMGLSDRNDRIIFVFPDMVLQPGGRVCVFADDTNQNVADNTLHAKFRISSRGMYQAKQITEESKAETIYLFNEYQKQIQKVELPTLNSDESYALMEESGDFERTYDYSPGYPNSAGGHRAYKDYFKITPGLLMINEVMPSPRSPLFVDEDGDLSDWVELYNAGDEDINLGNIALSDDPTKPLKWIFPENAIIPAGGYYPVFCSGKDKIEVGTEYPHTNFSINSQEETLLITNLAGERIDEITVRNLEKDTSYGRKPGELMTEWQVFTEPTPGHPNDEKGKAAADAYMQWLNKSGVYVTEVMASAAQILPFPEVAACDYVEIYNSSSQTVDLSGWGLSDNIGWPLKWTFPQGTSIFPGEYMVVMLDGADDPGNNPYRLHASFSLARAGGEMIILSDPTGRILDRMYLPEIPTDISYGRTMGVNGFYYYDAPTPGKMNGHGFTGFSAKPAFSMPSGLYWENISVTIDVPENTTVRYTLDGSIPTIDNGYIYYPGCPDMTNISDVKVIRARAFQAGRQPSETVTVSYIIKKYHQMDVVSLVCEPHELWDEKTGLLSEAPDLKYYDDPSTAVVNKSKIPFKTPVYRNWGKIDRPGYVEMFDYQTGDVYISQGIKMDLLGAYSLDMPQKSFKIRAQAAYGEKFFNYPLFEDREYDTYKSFTLRNSGNDNVWTRLVDGFQTRLVDKYLNQDEMMTLAWRPVAVYLNGTYWGHYNLRERKDRFSIGQFEGVDLEDKETLESITILRANSSVVQGSNEEYLAMRDTISTLSPNTNPEHLQYLYDHIDIDNYIEWLAVKMYFGDSDPGNIMFYKMPGEDSKWKCLLFDMDYGMFDSEYKSPQDYLKTSGMGDQKINNVIFRKMMESDEIREKFLTRLGEIHRIMTTDLMLAELDECVALIEPEMVQHYGRWAQYDVKTINIDSPTSPEGYLRYWGTRVDRLRNVICKRPHFLWKYVQQQFGLSNDEMIHYFGEQPPYLIWENGQKKLYEKK